MVHVGALFVPGPLEYYFELSERLRVDLAIVNVASAELYCEVNSPSVQFYGQTGVFRNVVRPVVPLDVALSRRR
jgi:hypothetical protein